jgi:hypothetical protein
MSRPKTYAVAFMCEEDGRFEVVEAFDERDDASANQYCEEHYGEQEWYLLDSDGRNVNGGERCLPCNTWWAVYRVGGEDAGEYLEHYRALSARLAIRAVNERSGIPTEELVAHLAYHRGVHPVDLGCCGGISHSDEIDACLAQNSYIQSKRTGGER